MECDGCTLCCKLLPIPWMDSKAGEYCKECEPNVGCKIYDEIEKCLSFNCAYMQQEKANINMRPDKCGVVFERIFDIIVGTIEPSIEEVSDIVKGQVNSFIKEGLGVVLFQDNNQPIVFKTKNKSSKEIWDVISKERERLYGRTLDNN